MTRGLDDLDRARQGHRSLGGVGRVEAPPAYEVVRAERCSDDLKRLRRLPEGAPTPVGDGRTSVRGVPGSGISSEVELVTSKVPAALYLTDLTLNKSFGGFLQRTNQIYLAAVVWDLSGKPPMVYPPVEVGAVRPEQLTYPLKENESIRFVGDGLQLWPQQPVKGGLFVQLVVMESDGDLRRLGAKMEKVREAVDSSALATVLAALAGGATGGTVIAVKEAASILGRAIETILKNDGDDRVAVFQGTYGAEGITSSRSDRYDQRGASIQLDLRTPSDAAPESRAPGAGREPRAPGAGLEPRAPGASPERRVPG